MSSTVRCTALSSASPAASLSCVRGNGLAGRGVAALSTRLALRRPSTSVRGTVLVRAHKVTLNFEGKAYELEVSEDENILEVALDQGLELPCDCRMGVCMTCPAKKVSGEIDQGAGMLSEDTIEKGYTLLCVASPKSDAVIDCIEEDELLAVQMGEI
uniref:2Fe-2S ferredoxin-type domain-containing protein n=1 Tax=Tetraselmis chuii TaxID=63592 RepID=A0A7S1SKS6_9CHLO|mmetsp:Transcript_16085/g.28597  ORF Transcript_16085/g.28597 Transcript_16085/m.28597 type:complete len:157 (+) Transcript_16085:164-634(+)|eukprot:CAMPEP_0168611640 /NCGR_PEP_ID=MMETSP0449_2-20121227/2469_1 /TAXON_ID=1082188 /ORGANISM="Strombidium rassoulzadegani, Strain ras09" /LENGTH=156 /DNA_ID=CAMNT_0008652107 /DNA_START=46 /DNA_END=516 /DNA_ORIENTATION=-